MIGSKVVPLLTLWKQQRQLEDPEIKEDIDLLITHLKDALQKLSTFDEYSSELKSGKLEWSPVHTSELFWKQTVTRLNENDYELIRILARHLSLSTNPLVLAVAAHDLGCYIQHHSLGRKILQEIGAKHRLMELMSNEDASVRYQALMAVQKFMTNSWDM
ncbi:V-type proton ATPase subunit H [Coelomomyces lativittatus]|nr:V-type proton ATPase subunit H [Coelomomyces lativittatus]KAJ1509241.1 V-type proton ATPase subunit H [Coelomomyces lativittatus]